MENVENILAFNAQLDDHVRNIREDYVHNVVKMVKEDLSIPFIARYRKTETGGMDAETIRKIQQCYESILKIQSKAASVIKTLGSEVSPEVKESIKSAKSLDEIQELYAPFKKGAKGTLAERARKLGLESVTIALSKHPCVDICANRYLKKGVEGLSTEHDVLTGVQYIIAEMVAKDQLIQQLVKKDIGKENVQLRSKSSTKSTEMDKAKKFTLYYDFQMCIDRLKSHQVLAINRGEQMKILSVKLVIFDNQRKRILSKIKKLWLSRYRQISSYNESVVCNAVEDSFKRLIEKTILRRMRSQLTKEAEREATDIFASNLKHLLLVAPVKNEKIMSIDPGFKNGCKVAVLDEHGQLLDTAIIHPFRPNTKEFSRDILVRLMGKHSVRVIALGNGTACRQMESVISEMMKNGDFRPLNVSYSIVNESGASIYSVTKEAKKEFPELDPNLISAVSIGRRLQDPLLEMVKIEAKHIGVGMYQRDIDESLLKASVEDVIEDCVSFVGIDLNACSVDMLRRVGGINKKQAASVVAYREKTGYFTNREELLSIKGIGKLTYRNCAGFVRIIPKRRFEPQNHIKVEDKENSGKKRKHVSDSDWEPPKKLSKSNNLKQLLPEPLDQTWIHPESYDVAQRTLKYFDVTSDMIGTEEIKKKVQMKLNTCGGEDFQALSEELRTNVETLKLIIDGIQQPVDYDLRSGFEKPIFKTGLTSIRQLKEGQKVSGAIRNNTSFGVFVDIGVDTDGLIHKSNMLYGVELGPGDRVECSVNNIDVNRQRVGLILLKKISKNIELK